MQTKPLQFLIFFTIFFLSDTVFGQGTKKNYPLKNINSKNTNKNLTPIHRPSVKKIGKPGETFRKKARGNWSIMLGGLTFVRPRYMGSDQYKVNGFPLVDIKYKNTSFLNYQEGLGVNLLYAPNFRVGVAFNYYGSRDEDDSDQLQGLSDIDAGVNVGAFGNISFGKFSTKLKIRQDISSNHDGLIISGRMGYKTALTNKLRVNINIGTTFANEDYMNTYFGISNVQSSASGLSQFNAGSSIKDFEGGLNFIYPINKNWTALTFTKYSRLLNDAASSPLVKVVGSKNQLKLAFGIAYRF